MVRYGVLMGLAMAAMSCGDSPVTEPVAVSGAPANADAPPTGTVSFDYSGSPISGTLSISGPPYSGIFITYTQAKYNRAQKSLTLEASITIDGYTYYVFVKTFRATPGIPATVWVDCGSLRDSFHCTQMTLFKDPIGGFGLDCGIATGTITITAISDTRVSGTFQGTGICLFVANSTFTVTNGAFDVPIVARPDVASKRPRKRR